MSSHTIERRRKLKSQHNLSSRYRDIGIKAVAAATRNKEKEAGVSNKEAGVSNNEKRGAKEDDHE